MYQEKGQEHEPWVMRHVNAMHLRRINPKVFIRAREDDHIGQWMGLHEFKRKLKKLNPNMRFTYNEAVVGIHVMKNVEIPESKYGECQWQRVHICAMPSARMFTSIPMDEWYTPDIFYWGECEDLPEDIDPKTGQKHLIKDWYRAEIGEVKEMQPQRGWGSVVRLLVAKGVFSYYAAKRMFPRWRIN